MTESPPRLSNALEIVCEGAVDALAPLWKLSPAVLPAALMEVLPPLLETWAQAASAVAADWYDELREADGIGGRFSAIIESLGELGAESLAGWGSEPLVLTEPNLEMARNRVEGGVQIRVTNAANRTVTHSAERDPKARGYMRRTNAGGCDFCVMVASKPTVYPKATATFSCHPHCFCEAVPTWGGKPLPVDPYKPSDHKSTPAERARVRKWIADNLK